MKILKQLIRYLLIIFLIGFITYTEITLVKYHTYKNLSNNIKSVKLIDNYPQYRVSFLQELHIKDDKNIKLDDLFNKYMENVINGHDTLINRTELKRRFKLNNIPNNFNKITESEKNLQRQMNYDDILKTINIDKENINNFKIIAISIIIITSLLIVLISHNLIISYRDLKIIFMITTAINLITYFILSNIKFTGNVKADLFNSIAKDVVKIYQNYLIVTSLIFIVISIIYIILYFINLFKMKKKGIVTEDTLFHDYDNQDEIEAQEVKEEMVSEELNTTKKTKNSKKTRKKEEK